MRRLRDWLLIILAGAACAGCQGCGHVAPPPPADCVAACAHLTQLGCSTSADLCGCLCASVAPSNASYPSCVNAASSCAVADACQ